MGVCVHVRARMLSLTSAGAGWPRKTLDAVIPGSYKENTYLGG